MSASPDVRYAKSGDLSIAYEILGAGPIDLVHVPGLLNNLEARAFSASLDRFYDRVQRFARLIHLDKRGSGLSDRLPPDVVASIEERLDDVRAVMDAAGSERAAIFGVADGGPAAIVFAATYPERTRALILSNTSARVAWAPDFPQGVPDEQVAAMLGVVERDWGTGFTAGIHSSGSENQRPAFARLERLAGTPRAAAAMFRALYATDVRDLLPGLRVPTLVIHDPGNLLWSLEASEYLVSHIPGARFASVRDPFLPEHAPSPDDTAAVFEEFLTGVRPADETVDRVLKTIVFTDIVDSTTRAAALGDRRWRALLDTHDAAVREELVRFRGQEIKTTGDGFFAAFDGPARAVRCAQAIRTRATSLGVQVRAGVHTGECELRGDDLAGIAVHLGARVAGLAGAGEILVTSTVRDLVAGSGLTFVERGRHTLKGIPGEWLVLAVDG